MKLKLRTGILVVLGILLIFSLPLIAQDQEEEDYTFRSTRWGMSVSEVIEQEGKPDGKSNLDSAEYGEGLFYEVSVVGIDATLFYYFTENKLTRCGYLFVETYLNKNHHIDNFKRIKKSVSKKYGSPEFDKKKWSQDLFKDDPSNYGQAVAIGHLEYVASWETEETELWLLLNGENFEVTHMLDYYSKEFEELVEQKEEEKAQSQF